MSRVVQIPKLLAVLVFSCSALLGTGSVRATSTDGYHMLLVVPVAVKSATYNTTAYIHNPGSDQINVNFTFYRGANYGDPVDLTSYDCGQHTIQPRRVLSFTDLNTLCPAAPTGPGSVYGWLAAAGTSTFAIVTRVDNSARTNGFEIESYPRHTFTGADTNVIGLTRTNGGTGMKSNCYVSALAESTTVELSVFNGTTEALLAGPVTINLAPTQMVRILDVFGATTGDYENGLLKVTTKEIGAAPKVYPGVIAFCVVENDQTRDADFRIGKASPVYDTHADRLWIDNHDEDNNPFATGSSGNDRTRHVVYFKHPDVVECLLGGGHEANLEMILRDPEGNVVMRRPGNVGFSGLFTGNKGEHGQPGILKGANCFAGLLLPCDQKPMDSTSLASSLAQLVDVGRRNAALPAS